MPRPHEFARTFLPVPLLLVAVVGLSACTSGPVSDVAMAGSTIVVPVRELGLLEVEGAGFAGSPGTQYESADPQRGYLAFRLDDPASGFELDTRVSTMARSVSWSNLGGTALIGNVLSIVDIPTDAPVGPHTLYAVHVFPDASEIQIVNWAESLTILPSSLDIDTPEGTVNVTADPLVARFCLKFGADCDALDYKDMIPAPMVVLRTKSSKVWSLVAEVNYPAGLIDVVDGVDVTRIMAYNQPARVWIEDDFANGRTIVHAVGSVSAFKGIGLAFRLVDPATGTLSPGQVSVDVLKVTDAAGAPLPIAGSDLTVLVR